MSELERMLTRLGNVSQRLETCESEWAIAYWTQVRDTLRRRVELADMYDRKVFKEGPLPMTPLLALRCVNY